MVTVGSQVRLEAKPGKEKELEAFLQAQLSFAVGEPETVAWFAVKYAEGAFGIFNVFPDEDGRKAHLEGEIATALSSSAESLLAKPPSIENLTVMASKIPGHEETPDSLG